MDICSLNTNSSNLVLGIGGCTLAIHVVACSLLLVEKVSLVALAWLLLDPALLWLHTHILRAANHGAVQQDESDGDTKSIQEGGPLWDTKWLVVNALLAGLTLGLSFAPLNLFVKIASGVAILFVLLFETHTLAPDIFSSASVTTVEGLLGTLVWSCKLVLGGASVLAAVLRHGSMSAQGMANLAALVLLVVPLAMATLMMQLLTGSKLVGMGFQGLGPLVLLVVPLAMATLMMQLLTGSKLVGMGFQGLGPIVLLVVPLAMATLMMQLLTGSKLLLTGSKLVGMGFQGVGPLVLLVVPLAMATLMMQLLTGSKLDTPIVSPTNRSHAKEADLKSLSGRGKTHSLDEDTPIVSPTNRSHADEADLKSLSGRGKKHSLDEVLSSIENSLVGDEIDVDEEAEKLLLKLGVATAFVGDEIDVDEEAEKLLLKLGMATASTLSTLTRMPTGETSLCTGCKLEMTTSDSAHHQRVSQPGSRRGSQAGNGGQAEGGQAGISEATLAAMLVGPDGLAWKEVVESLQEHSSDIAHDMKNPLNGVLALSQNVVAGTLGEIPKVACDQLNVGTFREIPKGTYGKIAKVACDQLNVGTFGKIPKVACDQLNVIPKVACDQLNVVRACAYHLLNMINMERDMLKMMNGGDGELNSSLSQISNQVDEVLKRMLPMYTRKGSVTIDTFNSADGLYGTFRCEDTGTGLSPEQLEKFNRPIQASCAEQLGLGLMMVKRLMAAFGGLLRVSNRESGGASVELIFMASRDAPSLVQNAPILVQDAPSLVQGDKQAAASAATAAASGNKKAATSAATAAAVAAATIAAPSFSKSLSSPNSAATITMAGTELATTNGEEAKYAGDSSVAGTELGAVNGDEANLAGGGSVAGTELATTNGDEAKYDGGGSVAGTELGTTYVDEAKFAGGGSVAGTELAATYRNEAKYAGGGSVAVTELGTINGEEAKYANDSSVAGTELGTNIGDEAKYAGGGSVAGTELGVSNEEISILIVDDDPVNMTILEDLLRGAGYATLLAGTGVEALEVYLTCDPPVKLVLLDVTLPDMSGHEVCLKMRSLTPGVPPPIIMISGKASTKDVIKGLQAGSSDYITKPFQPQEVVARIETQLRLFVEVLACIETQLRLFMGEVQQLQEAAERNGSASPHRNPAPLVHGKCVAARIETQLRLFMGEVQQLQEAAERNGSASPHRNPAPALFMVKSPAPARAAERNGALLSQILPPHILSSLKGGARIMVEKFPDVALLAADIAGFSNWHATAEHPPNLGPVSHLNRIFSPIALSQTSMGSQIDMLNDSYIAAIGHHLVDL
eukprot:gene26574-18341_t